MTPDTEVLAGLRALLRPTVRQLVEEALAERGADRPAVEGYLSVAQAALRAGIKPAALRAWITGTRNRKTGAVRPPSLPATKVPGSRDWKIRWGDLEALLSGGVSTDDAPVSDLGLERRKAALVQAVRKEPR